MRIAYLNTQYKPHLSTGVNAHVKQFVVNARELGHEIWMDGKEAHPLASLLPYGRLSLVRTLRGLDAFYVRIEWSLPPQARWAIPPFRPLLGNKPIFWEFNTVPEYGQIRGYSPKDVLHAESQLKKYGRGCDFAICVTDEISNYVRDILKIQKASTIPNGSDPVLFHPDATPVRRVESLPGTLQAVWMGSADLSWHHFDLLREAAEYLWIQGHCKRVQFHLIGRGMHGMRDMPPNVHYHGPVPYEELPGWLCRMDVGLVLYHDGPAKMGSPLKLFDYLASGLVVVANDHPQVRSVLSEIDQSELVLKQNDPKELAAILLNLSEQSDWRKQQGKKGRELIITKYNGKDLVKSIFAKIESI